MAAINLPSFAGGLPAARVDESLRQALAAIDRARECAVLWFAEVARRGLYRELGYASLELYAVEGLGFSRDRYFQFRRLADDLERLPLLKEAVVSGEIGWTKAQQVARVATSASEAKWVATATAVGRRELAEEVKRARRAAKARRAAVPELGLDVAAAAGDLPSTISFRLDGLQLARYEALVERAYKLGLVPAGVGREEVLLSALEALVETGDLCRHKSRKSKSPIQIVVQKCPACERAAVVTSHGEKVLSPPQAAAAVCDATVRAAEGPNRATIAPSVRAAVLARDRHRCTACGSTRFLEIHHVQPRDEEGSNTAADLTTLCSRCHAFHHRRVFAARGEVHRLDSQP
jgi:5-methylcytosine-specific restriction endonuclease McrA